MTSRTDSIPHVSYQSRYKANIRAEQDLYREAYWGDIVDGMYEMMQNKAKAIIRKQKEKRNLKTMEEKK